MAQKSSRNFSFVGQNIKKIRQAKNISQSDFASLFDLSRPSVGAYEEGRTEPKIETLIQISRYFNISIDVLLTKELSSKDIFSLGLLNKKLDQAHEVKSRPSKENHAPFISIDERVNFLVNGRDKSYLANLPKVGNPNSRDTIDLVLEHEGSKLEVDNKGIKHGDIFFCSKEEKLSSQQDRLWIIVKEDEITVGRIKNLQHDSLELTFDNPIHPSVQIARDTIAETYLVEGIFTNNTVQPSSLEDRLRAIEEKLKTI